MLSLNIPSVFFLIQLLPPKVQSKPRPRKKEDGSGRAGGDGGATGGRGRVQPHHHDRRGSADSAAEPCRLPAAGPPLRRLHDQDTQLMQHPETRNPVEALEETLRRAYLPVRSCQRRGYAYRCFMRAHHADELREVQGEIAFYLQLFPLVSYVDATLNWVKHLSKASDSSFQEASMECKVTGSQALMPAQQIQPSSLQQVRKDD